MCAELKVIFCYRGDRRDMMMCGLVNVIFHYSVGGSRRKMLICAAVRIIMCKGGGGGGK